MSFFRRRTREWPNNISMSDSLSQRWDKEWITYFLTEDPRVFFLPYEQISRDIHLSPMSAQEVYETHLSEGNQTSLPALDVWIEGNRLVDKRILEIGCGPGFLGKQLGLFSKAYIGIDYSKLALQIARLVSPPNCHYYHLSEQNAITEHFHTVDTMVGRNFFIHQNYTNFLWILQLAQRLLKPSGVMSADFYLPNPAVPQGVLHPAKSPLDPTYASCAFVYSIAEIEEGAERNGFVIDSTVDKPELQRRFVILRRL
jgi:SAM-dependent methyltransferase